MDKLPIDHIICGDCLEVMKGWPAESVDMCITSPPYYGLRDYGIEQIFGGDKDCEHKWEESILPKKGGNPGSNPLAVRNEAAKAVHQDHISNFCLKCHAWKGQLGLEPTPEMYIEHLTAIFNEVKRVLKKEGALWLNIGDTYSAGCMTGKQGKTSTTGINKGQGEATKLPSRKPPIGLFSKCLLMIPERLAWSLIQNGWILRNKICWHKPNGMPSSVKDRFTNKYEFVYLFSKSRKYWFDLDAVREEHKEVSIKRAMPHRANVIGNKGHPAGSQEIENEQFCHPQGKNPGDVWTIPTVPCPVKGVHFATFPEELCRRAIKAGCPEKGIVLDPFCGVGTACYVARKLRRRYIGIDIKPQYCEKAENKRLAQGVLYG